MSVVHNYILMAPIDTLNEGDPDPIELLNKAVQAALDGSSYSFGNGFARVDQHAGGPKHFEANLFLLAANFLRPEELLPLVRPYFEFVLESLPEGYSRDDFQLFVKIDLEDRFIEVPIWP